MHRASVDFPAAVFPQRRYPDGEDTCIEWTREKLKGADGGRSEPEDGRSQSVRLAAPAANLGFRGYKAGFFKFTMTI